MAYRLAERGVMRADGACIPQDGDNLDWQAYQTWRAAGGIPEPMPLVAVPPRTATGKQLRYALNQIAKLEAWEAAVVQASASTRIYWLHETEPPENSAKMKRLCAATGVDLAALYDLAVAL